MKSYKKILFALLVLIAIVLAIVLNKDEKPVDTRPMVAVSTFSLYDITKHIAGDTVQIVNILPFGVDPHSFEPTPKLMAKIEKSLVVFYSGAGLEPWTHGYKFQHKAIDMSEHVRLRKIDADEHEFHQHHDAQCVHNTLDPHYWLDFANMAKAANIVTKELIKIAPKNELLYITNKDKYIKMLTALNTAYNDGLKSCKLDTIIVNHNAFGYLSHRFGFHIEALSGLTPEAQPNAKNMARLIKDIKQDDAPVIFSESFVSSKAMKSIAAEVGVATETLQPLGNITADEAKQNLSYEDIMKTNLVKIRKALMCR